MLLQVYTPSRSPRLEYVLDFICTQFLYCEYQIISSPETYQKAAPPFLNYSSQRIHTQECFIPASGWLEESTIQAPDISIFQHDELPAFFLQEATDADFPFDLFGLQFYLLSRYEEYLPFSADSHQRFSARQSLAFKAGFLNQPLVDLWALKLKSTLQSKFPDWNFSHKKFTFLPTYDVDMAWSYRHKGIFRFMGACLKDLIRGKFIALGQRLRVAMGLENDPYFTFDYMDKLHQKFHVKPLYFWLLGDLGAYDKNISSKKKAFQKLIYEHSEKYEMGIHPSYRSNELERLLPVEKQRLECISGKLVSRSRQHFLRLRFPQTYRRLLAAGIREDYTLGYAGQIGFRASTASAFYWYDLEKDQKTDLKLFPLMAMDVTLRQYMALEPSAAIQKTKELIATTRAVGGTFVSLWHNTSFSESEGWEGWRKVYEAILAEGVQKE